MYNSYRKTVIKQRDCMQLYIEPACLICRINETINQSKRDRERWVLVLTAELITFRVYITHRRWNRSSRISTIYHPRHFWSSSSSTPGHNRSTTWSKSKPELVWMVVEFLTKEPDGLICGDKQTKWLCFCITRQKSNVNEYFMNGSIKVAFTR